MTENVNITTLVRVNLIDTVVLFSMVLGYLRARILVKLLVSVVNDNLDFFMTGRSCNNTKQY